MALIHDMVVTEHYYVLICGPIALQPAKFAMQVRTPTWGLQKQGHSAMRG